MIPRTFTSIYFVDRIKYYIHENCVNKINVKWNVE